MLTVQSYAPARISFAGGGTDVPPYVDAYGGVVVNATIDRGVTVRFTDDSQPMEISSRDLLESHTFGMNVRGKGRVIGRIVDLFGGNGLSSGRISINSDVPPGSGLGSSSALTIALLQLLDHLRGKEDGSPEDLASRALEIERESFGIALGKQDPYAIAIGGFKKVEFLKGGGSRYSYIKNLEFMRTVERRSLLVYTGKTRESSTLLRRQMEMSKRGEKETISSLDDLKRIALSTFDSAERGDFDEFCSLINEGWQIKKRGSGVSNETVDSIISTALKNGARAARLLGGGSQGFILLISEESRMRELQRSMMSVSRFAIRVSLDGKKRQVVSEQ
ncbi:MAG: kinase [Candidatus Thermoplasmatota archaeon]|jgi:D-glycero-alpha-D-manno-heptose-7-phosphate kinase|nr:kinase [Candidatus Thermoplasmatota archaeon]MCL5681104.1 kinase [Candidatus Thermoplasmatota archaeon]